MSHLAKAREVFDIELAALCRDAATRKSVLCLNLHWPFFRLVIV
jgi:hypothetical protein